MLDPICYLDKEELIPELGITFSPLDLQASG